MKFDVRFHYKRLLSRPEFRENRLCNGHTVLKDANQFVLVIYAFLDRSG